MQQRYIYPITETNVDGCHTNVTEYVYFDRQLSDEQTAALRAELAAVKTQASDKCYDTGTIIETALQIPELADLHPEIGGSPFVDEIMF